MKTANEIIQLLDDAREGRFDCSETQSAIGDAQSYLQNREPYAYTYVHIDGKRMWRMASSRISKLEFGWTETPLFA